MCLSTLSDLEPWTFIAAYDPRCKWGVRDLSRPWVCGGLVVFDWWAVKIFGGNELAGSVAWVLGSGCGA